MAQPTFSIVVPVHNVRAYLRECLDSILGQSFGDFELIAIDDASPDGSGDVLDEYAAADDRVMVRHLPKNVGLGAARDVGIDAASGRYLLFVDGDDTLTTDSLAAIAARIDRTDEPDVVVFDYARTYWDGSVRRNVLADVLAAPGADVVDVVQRPDLLTLLMVVWNKAYRLDFVREHGFRFPKGYYEDLPWTYPVMLIARRIAILDRVCYHYRQRRHGNILRSSNRGHFDVFDQYARVFAYIDANPELERWRTFMFRRMVRHLLEILANRRRVSSGLKREFFDAFGDSFARHRPPGYELPSGRPGAKLRTVARRDYRAYLVMDAVARTERTAKREVGTARRGARQVMRVGRGGYIRAYYQAELRRPIDENLAVYSAYWSTNYACNPAAIYEKAKQLAPHIRGVWVVEKGFEHRMPAGVEYVTLYTPEYYRVMATAKYFVNNANFASNIVKRPGTVHVQTQHGTPLKAMGLGLLDHPVGAAGMNFPKLMQRSDRWDYLVSANRFSSEVWERSFPNSYVTLEVGYPRNDRLVAAGEADTRAVRARLGLPSDKTLLLYAPTFRDWIRDRFYSPIDLLDFCERLGDDFVVLVRGHYFAERDEPLVRLEEQGLLRDVTDLASIEDLMIASDALLTDYSSVMFDYANLDRPIVIYAPDWETYSRIRGVNFDLFAHPPGVVETTQEGLVDAFVSERYRDTGSQRKEFAQTFCEWDDGHAAERVVLRVFLGGLDSRAQRSTGVAQSDVGPQGDVGLPRDRVPASGPDAPGSGPR